MKLWLAIGASALSTLLVSVLFLQGHAPGDAADQARDKRTITTSGAATLKIKPDAARVYFAVQTVAKTIHEAKGKQQPVEKGHRRPAAPSTSRT